MAIILIYCTQTDVDTFPHMLFNCMVTPEEVKCDDTITKILLL